MKKPTITDHVVKNTPTPPAVGIVLTAALLDGLSNYPYESSRPSFGVIDGGTVVANTVTGYNAYLRHAQSIARVATLTEYASLEAFGRDVIIVDGILFLGRWNDGVVVNQQ